VDIIVYRGVTRLDGGNFQTRSDTGYGTTVIATEVRDTEWPYLAPHLPTPKRSGRPRVHPVREMLHAIVAVLRSGCAWRWLPHEVLPWRPVSHSCRRWCVQGLRETRHAGLRAAVRMQAGHGLPPSAAMLDRQSVPINAAPSPGHAVPTREVNHTDQSVIRSARIASAARAARSMTCGRLYLCDTLLGEHRHDRHGLGA
jgi:transposase